MNNDSILVNTCMLEDLISRHIIAMCQRLFINPLGQWIPRFRRITSPNYISAQELDCNDSN